MRRENKKVFSYYSYSNLGCYTKNYRSRNILIKLLLNILETISLDKQNLSNLDLNIEQAIINLDLEKTQTLEDIQGVKIPKKEIDSIQKRLNLKEETNL